MVSTYILSYLIPLFKKKLCWAVIQYISCLAGENENKEFYVPGTSIHVTVVHNLYYTAWYPACTTIINNTVYIASIVRMFN